MTRQIIPTDQELIEWSKTSGIKVVRTNEAIRVRNISLKEIEAINSTFAKSEKEGLETIQEKFGLQDWIPYFSFAMSRVLSDKVRKNLILAQNTTRKYSTFYGEHINQNSEDFSEQFEEAKKICQNKELLAVLDPAEINSENLGEKITYLLKNGHKKCVIQYRDCLRYLQGWEALRLASKDKMHWIVVDVAPKNTGGIEKYSYLLFPLFFNENISVSHARGRGFGDGKPPINWLNNHFSYKENKQLEKNISRTKLLAHSRIYNINKAIEIAQSKLQVPELQILSSDIDGISHFAKQLRLVNIG